MDRVEYHDPAAPAENAVVRTASDAVAPPGRADPPPPHPLVAAACEALELAGVRWALLRGERDLVDPRGDVDILVESPRDLRAIERALRPLGIIAVPELGAGAHRIFVGHHRPTARWIELDIEWDLDFGPQQHFIRNWLSPALRSGATPAVLSRRRRSLDVPNAWVLHPDDGFWALLLHAVVDKATVAEKHADRLVELCADATPSSPLAKVVTGVCPEGWDAERVIRCARAEDWATLVELGRGLARRASARRPVGHRARALVRGLRRLSRAVGPVLVTRGLSVAVLGPDGAGGSALAAGLVSERPVAARLVATYHRLRGRLIVLDWHVRDALVAPTPVERFVPGFLVRTRPRPDVVIVLDLPRSEVGVRRHYLALAERLRADVVDADRPRDEVLGDAVADVWKACVSHRYGASRTVVAALRRV